MLHYVHQLVSNCVCLLFAAGQGFIGAFSLKTVKLVQPNQNNELKNSGALYSAESNSSWW